MAAENQTTPLEAARLRYEAAVRARAAAKREWSEALHALIDAKNAADREALAHAE